MICLKQQLYLFWMVEKWTNFHKIIDMKHDDGDKDLPLFMLRKFFMLYEVRLLIRTNEITKLKDLKDEYTGEDLNVSRGGV